MSQRNKIVKPRKRYDNGVIGKNRIVVSKGRGKSKNKVYHVKTHFGTSRYEFAKSVPEEDIKIWIKETLDGTTEYPFVEEVNLELLKQEKE